MKDNYSDTRNCAVIILAGGKSARLGQAKQLLPYGNKNLLQHAVDSAAHTGLEPIIVVLGAGENIISKSLTGMPVKIVVNSAWEEGMASSIRCGIYELIHHYPQSDGVIIMVCDQPFVSAGLLDALLETHHGTGKPVIASTYEGINGTPVLFHRNIFSSLMELKGDKGARKFLGEHPEWVATVPFPEGKLDIDTETDYENLQQWKKNPDK